MKKPTPSLLMALIASFGLVSCNSANFGRGSNTQGTTTTTTVPETASVGNVASPVCQQKLAIVLMLDASDSMKDADSSGGTSNGAAPTRKIDVIIAAAKDFIGLFNDKSDMFGLVTFATDVKSSIPLSTKTDELLAAIAQMSPGGMTNIAGALQHAAGLMTDAEITDDKTFKRTIVMMSDGEQTSHQDGPPLPVATEIKTHGIKIVTLGYALSGDKSTMQSIASQTDLYFDAQNASALTDSFHKIAAMVCQP